MRRLAFALGILLITISAAAQDTATVRVYRFSWRGTNYATCPVYADGSQVANLKGGRYLDLALPAGKHEFRSRMKAQRLTLDLEPGKTYYLRLRYADSGWTGNDLVRVDDDSGIAETAKLKLQK